MNKLNTRKVLALSVIFAILGTMTVAFQNFTENEQGAKKSPSLLNAICAALESAEQDTAKQKVALNVDVKHIEASTLKKKREPMAIIDQTEALTESNPHWAVSEADEEVVVEDSIESELLDSPAE